MTGLWGYAPFTYRGLVEFLVVAEDVLDTLRDEQMTRKEAVHQLFYDVLMEPAEHLDLSTSLVERNRFKARQMRLYSQ